METALCVVRSYASARCPSRRQVTLAALRRVACPKRRRHLMVTVATRYRRRLRHGLGRKRLPEMPLLFTRQLNSGVAIGLHLPDVLSLIADA